MNDSLSVEICRRGKNKNRTTKTGAVGKSLKWEKRKKKLNERVEVKNMQEVRNVEDWNKNLREQQY